MEERISPQKFLHKSTLGVALMGLLILTPFSVNNFVQGRYFLGTGSLVIVIILAVNAWTITRNRYYPSVIFFMLVPAIVFFLALAFYRQGIIGAFWSYPATIAFYFILPERKAWLANLLLLLVIIPVSWVNLENLLAVRFGATLLSVSFFAAVFIRVITQQQHKLQAQAVTDHLTGLFNRSLLEVSLAQAIEQYNRKQEPVTAIVCDIDRFKIINDTRGHDAGDAVLRGIGEFLAKRFRRVDKVFRLGGEEFLVLLHNTDLAGGYRIAEEMRKSIEALEILSGQHVTISAGIAAYQPGEDWSEWIKRADENLYRAKQEGRNRVIA